MNTLRIEHPISDYDTWKAAFDRFADVRAETGVRSHRISQPVDDENFVAIDLEFDAPEQAAEFLDFLRNRIWAEFANSPALAGDPVARIFQIVDVG